MHTSFNFIERDKPIFSPRVYVTFFVTISFDFSFERFATYDNRKKEMFSTPERSVFGRLRVHIRETDARL